MEEAVLTGESLPVDKVVVGQAGAEVDDEADRLWSGTLVTRGSGQGAVTETGVGTRFGRIAERLRKPRTETPLQRELGGLTARLGTIAVALAVGVFLLMIVGAGATGASLQRAFLTAVALAVAAVPEGLAAVTTVALALGVRRMAERGAIVRRLPAVEALGAVDILAIDKTGTVTENRMQVAGLHTADATADSLDELPPSLADPVRRVAVLCNDAELEPPLGDPLEIALLQAVGPQAVDDLRHVHTRCAALPFDAERRRMTAVTTDGGSLTVHVKGAPEELLERCTDVLLGDGSSAQLTDVRREELATAAAALAQWGSRVLGLACSESTGYPKTSPTRRPSSRFSHSSTCGTRSGRRPRTPCETSATRASGSSW